MQTAAKLADLKAMVTPLEKTGSRISPALPSKAKPLPHSDVTLPEYPVMQRAGVSHADLASRLRRPGAWPTSACNRSMSLPGYCARNSVRATPTCEQRPSENGMVQYQKSTYCGCTVMRIFCRSKYEPTGMLSCTWVKIALRGGKVDGYSRPSKRGRTRPKPLESSRKSAATP